MEFVLVKDSDMSDMLEMPGMEEEVVFSGPSTYNIAKIPGLAVELQSLYNCSENKYLVEYFIRTLDYFLGYEVDNNSTCSHVLGVYTEIVFYGALSGVNTDVFTKIKPWLEYYLYACEEQMDAQELSTAPDKIKENIDNARGCLTIEDKLKLLSILKTKIVTTKLV